MIPICWKQSNIYVFGLSPKITDYYGSLGRWSIILNIKRTIKFGEDTMASKRKVILPELEIVAFPRNEVFSLSKF